ncbi:MAG: XrtN system VIT domain-containing protein, partial [Bacteroidota bacterium]
RWDTLQRSIEDAEQSYQLQTDLDLPQWVHIASELPEGKLTAEVMLASGVTQRSFWRSGGFGGLNSGTDEFEIHNPLALIAMTLYGELELEEDEVVNILEANYDARHMTHRRLWSGHNLSTSEVHTKVDLYPQFRLAYEEMTIHIHHNGKTNRWRDEQEAVYSFHLPEGAVATSLSLWIEGEEQFSRLTTKSKADSAYTQIVGVEVRDPALLHWQEGNRVSVTVFPCTPEEDRIFKIGFTTPLTDEGERLRLRHVSFDGPATWKATATTEIHVHSDQELAYVQKPTIWHNEEDGYSYKGSYQSDWTLSFKETALSDAFFQFNGFQYQLAESRQNLQSWTAEEVILDINSSWDPITYRKILDKVGEKPVFVFLPEKTKITEDNADEVFLQLRKQAFTLLPLYTLSNSENSLVITKSRGMSPLLVDVENTFYHNRMYEYFSSKPPAIKMICLGEEIPP